MAVSRFYRVCEVLGMLGTAWIGGLLVYLGAPLWTWLVTVPAFVLVEFGCFASRDRKHELARARELAAKWRAAPQDPDEPLLAMAADELEAALAQNGERVGRDRTTAREG